VRDVSTPKQEQIPEPPESLAPELREKLKSLAKSLRDLADLVEKTSKEIEEQRKKMLGVSK